MNIEKDGYRFFKTSERGERVKKWNNFVRTDDFFFHFYFFTHISQCKWNQFYMSNLENLFVKLMVTGPVKQYEVFLLSSMKSFCSACTKNLKAPPTVAFNLYKLYRQGWFNTWWFCLACKADRIMQNLKIQISQFHGSLNIKLQMECPPSPSLLPVPLKIKKMFQLFPLVKFLKLNKFCWAGNN